MTEHCYLRTCERPVTTHLRGASFCDLHARVALDTGFDPEDTALMPPCPTDHEPHPAAAPHVHPPLWREFAEAASTYALTAVLIVLACFAVGLSCGAATLGYRLLSESRVAQ